MGSAAAGRKGQSQDPGPFLMVLTRLPEHVDFWGQGRRNPLSAEARLAEAGEAGPCSPSMSPRPATLTGGAVAVKPADGTGGLGGVRLGP